MIRRRYALAVALVCSMGLIAGCTGWGTDGPADGDALEDDGADDLVEADAASDAADSDASNATNSDDENDIGNQDSASDAADTNDGSDSDNDATSQDTNPDADSDDSADTTTNDPDDLSVEDDESQAEQSDTDDNDAPATDDDGIEEGDNTGEGDLSLVERNVDTGDDTSNEYVVFENTGDAELDLTGWQVRDDPDDGRVAGNNLNPYSFSNIVIPPGDQVRLTTGDGEDTNTEVFWGISNAVWDETGDRIIVENNEGEIVLDESYTENGDGNGDTSTDGGDDGGQDGSNDEARNDETNDGDEDEDTDEPETHTVTVEVVDGDGDPVPSTIGVESGDGESIHDGEETATEELDLEAGSSVVVAASPSADDYAIDGDGERTVDVDGDETVTFEAEHDPTADDENRSLTVVVEDSDGDPIEDQEVLIGPIDVEESYWTDTEGEVEYVLEPPHADVVELQVTVGGESETVYLDEENPHQTESFTIDAEGGETAMLVAAAV